MKLKHSLYKNLLHSIPAVPPETGGILGGADGIVTDILFDKNIPEYDSGVYIPDTDFLNQAIVNWQKQNVWFMGIFHSHPMHECGLSMADKEYISKIMQVMPAAFSRLYFPIILPGEGIYAYCASKKGDTCQINACEIIII